MNERWEGADERMKGEEEGRAQDEGRRTARRRKIKSAQDYKNTRCRWVERVLIKVRKRRRVNQKYSVRLF